IRLLLAMLVGCGVEPPGVLFTYMVATDDPTLDAELDRASVTWEPIGVYRVREPDTPDLYAATVEWVPADSIPVDGRFQPWDSRILIRDSLEVGSFRIALVLAHEVGHAIMRSG